MTDKEIRSAIEAVLFASGTSVGAHQLAQALEVTEGVVNKQAEELIKEYKEMERGITILKLAKSYQMVSQKAYAAQIRKAMDLRRNIPLSQAALEVLAVIAYNQPVTKSFIEQVRGVDCAGVIGSLTAKDLIEEKGRLELPGRPLLYGTTENFLRCFSLSGLEDLPALPTNDEETVADNIEDDDQLSIFNDEKNEEEGAETTEGKQDTGSEAVQEVQEESEVEVNDAATKEKEEEIVSAEEELTSEEEIQDASEVGDSTGSVDSSIEETVVEEDKENIE